MEKWINMINKIGSIPCPVCGGLMKNSKIKNVHECDTCGRTTEFIPKKYYNKTINKSKLILNNSSYLSKIALSVLHP